MGVFAKRARLTSQPQYAAGVDRGAPLAAGLVLADTGVRVSQSGIVVGTRDVITPSLVASGFGSTLGAGTSDSIESSFSGNLSDRTYFIWLRVNSGGPSNLGRVFSKRTASATETDALLVDQSNAGGGVRLIQFIQAHSTTGGDWRWDLPNGEYRLCLRYSNASTANVPQLFIDGVLRTLTAAVSPVQPVGTPVTNSDPYVFGNRKSDNARVFDGWIGPRFFWNRLLSDAEIQSVSADPWQLFAPRRVLLPAAGAGPVTHATAGALTNAGATLAGSAAVVRVHATSGTLANAGAVIAASAARTRAHPTSGALANAGAIVVGSAARAGGATTHDATGVLLGGGATLAGAAARIAVHGTTGALVAGGAFVAGSAARVGAPVTHATSGSLAGQGAVIVGVASGPAVIPGDQVLSIPRLGLRVKTGELFPLVLDGANVPIAYRRGNGSIVSIRLINTATRSAAINAQGDIIQII